MKTGVALSGCDIGGVAAFAVLEGLERMGIRPTMVSACSIAAISSWLYCSGFPEKSNERLINRFLSQYRRKGIDGALLQFSKSLTGRNYPIRAQFTINCVSLSDQKIVTFTNDFSVTASNLETRRFDDPYFPLSATVNANSPFSSTVFERDGLCDYCASFGAPVYPLLMCGMEKIISISFLPKSPKTAYELLVRQAIQAGRSLEHSCIELYFEPEEADIQAYNRQALEQLKSAEERLYDQLFFR